MTLKQRLLPACLGLFSLVALIAANGGAERARAAVADPPPCFGICDAPEEVQLPDPQRSVLVLNVGWETGDPSTTAKLEASALPRYASLIRGDVNRFMRDSAAPLPFAEWQVTEGGSYLLPAPRELASTANLCSSKTTASEVLKAARSAALARGIDTAPYKVVAIHYATGVCSSGGFKSPELNLVTLFSSLPQVAERAFGEVLGLHQASFLSCADAAGNPIPYGSRCTDVESGDPYDAMGSGSGSYTGLAASQAGWLWGQGIEAATGDTSNTYFLNPYTAPSHSQRVLTVRDGVTSFWLEYRQPTGVDSPLYNGGIGYRPVTPGLIVHRAVLKSGVSESLFPQLLDMTPATPATDAGLPVGRTWANPLGEMQITLNSATAAGATVTVSSQRRSVPNVVDLTRKAAIASIQLNGFVYGGLSSKFSCDYIGKVMSQTPAAGTRLMPGARVSIVEGVRDARHPCN